MRYTLGDLVYPTDLLRPIPCRVARADACRVPGRSMQILWLEPLDGPWPPGTLLVRMDDAVRLLAQAAGRPVAVPVTSRAAVRMQQQPGTRDRTPAVARRRARSAPLRVLRAPGRPATPLQ